MSDLLNRIKNTQPANGDIGVPLLSTLTVTLSGLDYDEDSLIEGFFVEGPDTDQYVGPGLQLLSYPDNVSQNTNLDDFLQSPGYRGIAIGDVTVTGIAGDTVVTFSPAYPLAALTDYVLNLHSVLASDGITDIDGFVSLSFQTGTGSIEEIPSTVSTSVLNTTASIPILDSNGTPLSIVKITPADHSIENSIDTRQIIIEFNKPIDPASVTDDTVSVVTSAISDHPSLNVTTQGELVKSMQVSGNLLIISI